MNSSQLQGIAAAAGTVARELNAYDPKGIQQDWPIGPVMATNNELTRLGFKVQELADMIQKLASHLVGDAPGYSSDSPDSPKYTTG